MYRKYIKRLIDIIISVIGIVISLPILIISSILIKIEYPLEPVIFKQKRVGYKEKIFEIIKFRTMKVNPKTGVNEITKIGYILRSTSIDELPQLFNILKGDMSLIGPRPWIEEYSKYFTNNERKRSEVLPGISGLAQVNGRNGITIKDKLELDIEYVENQSIILDLKIFLKTIYIVFRKSDVSLPEESIKDEIRYLKRKFYEQKVNEIFSNEFNFAETNLESQKLEEIT